MKPNTDHVLSPHPCFVEVRLGQFNSNRQEGLKLALTATIRGKDAQLKQVLLFAKWNYLRD